LKYALRIVDTLRSRSAVLLILIGALTLNSLAQDTGKQPRTVTLKQGQIFQMKLAERLSSGRAQVGDDVVLRLSKPILAEGETVLPKDWTIHARIRNVKRASKNCQAGSINWELEPPAMPDREKIEIRFLDESVARRRLLDQSSRDAAQPVPEANTGEKARCKKGASVGGILKGIAVTPLIVMAFPIQILSEGEASCPGGKGREESFWAGKPFFAEVADDVQMSVH